MTFLVCRNYTARAHFRYPVPSRTAQTSRPSPPCRGITTPDSPSVPIPTPPGRSRTRRPRPRATSCRRYGKETGKRKTAHRLGSRTSLPVRCDFCVVWVKFFCSLKVITFYIAKHPESHRFRGVSCDSDTI